MTNAIGRIHLMRCVLLGILLLPAVALASGGGDVARLVIVADTRHLPAVLKFWGNLYNESHVYFTALTVSIIPVLGIFFGMGADLTMSRLGIDLHSRELAEH